MTEFAELHFPEESKAIIERHKAVYEKRHKNLHLRIKAIEDEAQLMRTRSDVENAETGSEYLSTENMPEPEEVPEEVVPVEEPDLQVPLDDTLIYDTVWMPERKDKILKKQVAANGSNQAA